MFLITKKNLYFQFAFFATFEDISRPFLASTLSTSWFLLDLLFLRFFAISKKNPSYFCDFYDICGHFGALLSFFVFLSLEFCYICYFCDFCDICHGCFQLARKILVSFAIFAVFADISGPFLVSSFSKSGILLNLLFLRFLRYLSRAFSARKKNHCYFCDFWDICGHFGPPFGFFFFLV